jgi:hypothetical protein
MSDFEAGTGELLLYPDMNEVRAWMRDNKSMALTDKLMSEKDAVTRFIAEGNYLATELYGSVRAPMGICREIVRQGYKNLNIAGQGVMETELLIAADCVRKIDLTYQGWEVYGISNVLRRAAEGGRVKINEWSNASLAWARIPTNIPRPRPSPAPSQDRPWRRFRPPWWTSGFCTYTVPIAMVTANWTAFPASHGSWHGPPNGS